MSKPVYFKLGSTDKIYKADSCRGFEVGLDWTKMVEVVEFRNIHNVHVDVLAHQYFNRNFHNTSCSLYLVKEGDVLYESVKDSRLARKMYPNAIQHEGWLLIESE